MSLHIPVVVCGGGVIGIFISYYLSQYLENDQFVLFEKNEFLGEGNSSRNSGVIHSGIYYDHNSFKHRYCLEGNRLWKELAHKFDIQINECGKYIISTSSLEEQQLNTLYQKGIQNGVENIRFITKKEKEELSEFVNIDNAFFIPSTAILDVSSALKTFENYLYKKDIPILKNDKIENVIFENDHFVLETSNSGTLTCDYFINAAGLGAVNVRKMLGLNDLENYFVKGNYVKLNRKYYNDKLIYPIPLKGLKGLGVHTSFDIEGNVRFGPNTEDVNGDYDFKVSQDVVDVMYPEIRKIFKDISKENLSVDYSGVRTKIRRNGNLYNDFWIKDSSEHGIVNYFEFCGIESPGLTSSLAIAKEFVDLNFS